MSSHKTFAVLAVSVLSLAVASVPSPASRVAVYGVYPSPDLPEDGLKQALGSAVQELTAKWGVMSTHVIEGELIRSLDVRTDERIAEHARPGLVGLTSGRMRWHENATLPWHAIEYLAQVHALQAFVESNAPFGLILQDPGVVGHSAFLSSTIQSRENLGNEVVGVGEAWDVLLLGWQAAPAVDNSGSSGSVASVGQRLTPDVPARLVPASIAKVGSSITLAHAYRWRGMHAYVVTRHGAQAILKDALPLSSRFWAHVVGKAKTGSLHVSWAPDGSLWIPTTRAEPEFTCHECDLEAAYELYNGVAMQWLARSVQALFLAFALGGLVYFVLPRTWRPERGACIPKRVGSAWASMMGKDGESAALSSRLMRVTCNVLVQLFNLLRLYLLFFLRLVFAYILAILLHPVVRLALLGGVGYTVYEAITHPIWPVDGVAARDKLESLRLVPLTGEAGKLWDDFAVTVTHPSHGIHHATISTLPHPSLDRLITTAGWYGDKVTVLGMHDKRFTTWGAGFGVKLELIHGFLRTVPPDDLIIFSDAFDVLMMASHADMRSMFLHTVKLAMGREGTDPAGESHHRVPSILFGAELFAHPDGWRWEKYPATDRKFQEHQYLNSGSYMGIAKDLLAVMDRYPYVVADDDQRYWTTAYLDSRTDPTLPRIVLDHEQDVFLCMGGYRMVDHMAFNPAVGKWKFRTSAGVPGLVHFNSNKEDVAPLFHALQSGWSPYDIRFAASFHLRVLLGLCAGLIFLTGLGLGRRLDGWLVMGLGSGSEGDVKEGVSVSSKAPHLPGGSTPSDGAGVSGLVTVMRSALSGLQFSGPAGGPMHAAAQSIGRTREGKGAE